MDFTNLYEQPCVLAKQIEFRWFHSKLAGEDGAKYDNLHHRLSHNMPFLRRTLAYSRPQSFSKRSQGRTEAAAKAHRKHRKFDLLRGLFGHQCPSAKRHASPLHHNDGLAPYSKASISCKRKSPFGHIRGEGIASAICTTNSFKQSETAADSMVLGKVVRANAGGTKKSRGANGTFAPPRKVFFHFFHIGSNGVPAVHIEMREGTRCPFCFFDPCTHHGLIIHCSTVHNDRLSFSQQLKDDRGNLHLAIHSKPFWPSSESKHDRQEHLVDFVFIRQGMQPQFPRVPYAKIPSHILASIDLAERKKRVRLLETQAADQEITSRYTHGHGFPIRQYYHARTKLPMLGNDWDEDSDEEPDDTWLHRMGEVLMDDFDDVMGSEKVFMKIWNKFMMKSHTLTADKNIPQKCTEFVSTHGHKLVEFELRQNLMLHLFNLWDSRLLSPSHILSCLSAYDTIHEDARGEFSSTIPQHAGLPRKRERPVTTSDLSPPTKKSAQTRRR